MNTRPWNIIKTRLKSRLADKPFSIWIEPIRVLEEADDRLVLGLPNRFARQWVRQHYGTLLRELADSVSGGRAAVELKIAPPERRPKASPEGVMVQPELPYQAGRLLRPRGGLCDQFTFERFISGPANVFARQAAMELASGQGMAVGSLFLTADTGLGKSHLSQAVGHQLLDFAPGSRVLYLSAEEFTNQMVSAIRTGKADEFKNKFRNRCDSLILEDVQFLTGKEKTQSELAATLDVLWSGGKRVIFTSSKTPDQIPGLRSELASRLSTGLVARIGSPDFETRVRIIMAKAKARALNMPMEVAEVLADSVQGDVRRLESAMLGVAARSRYMGRPLSLDLVQEEVGVARRPAGQPLDLESITNTVCHYYRLEKADLLSRSRAKRISEARSVALYLCRRLTEHSLAEIGRRFDRRHSTVSYAVNRVEKAIHHQSSLGRQALLLTDRIGKAP